ncbi:MAG: isochorismatase family protein [Gemmatimonadota bacterium]|nr:MAG: isochorismatase family protein [Gemmatimonadota bacterium]
MNVEGRISKAEVRRTHVCVHQTALDLLDAGYEVQVIAGVFGGRADSVTTRAGLD